MCSYLTDGLIQQRFAGRIADYFAYNYPDIRVFFDVNAIEPGQDFVQAIRSRIESSEVVLAYDRGELAERS